MRIPYLSSISLLFQLLSQCSCSTHEFSVVLTILALCLRALKCGSGKHKKILLSCDLVKKLGRNFIVLARKQATFWKARVSVCCERSAFAFVWTYSVTAERISMPALSYISSYALSE
jgi:hypothetical protein